MKWFLIFTTGFLVHTNILLGQTSNLTVLKGIVTEYDSKKPIEASIQIVDNEKNVVVYEANSNSESGKYLLSLPGGKNYGIIVTADKLLFHSENIDLTDFEGYQEVEKDIALKAFDIGSNTVLNNIFFDFDDFKILDESKPELEHVVNVMKENEKIMIEISGHTDDVGDDKYNLQLSQRRASSVVMYLISQGIDPSRLIAKGSGELHPLAPNKLPDGEDNPEGRAKNRRTEFKIIGVVKK
jgi:outer membrane protein OmpA-like peptidoglycan-associated protein